MTYRIFISILLAFYSFVATAGVITGRLEYEDAEPGDTFQVIVADDVLAIYYAPIAPAVYPNFEFELEYDYADSIDYFALAIKMSGFGIPTSGTPGGMFPEYPFHTVGGSRSGLVIPIAEEVSITGIIHYYDSLFSDIYLNIYDLYPIAIGGDTTLEIGPLPIGDSIFTIDDIPAGPKLF
jgi:hypothetical protein